MTFVPLNKVAPGMVVDRDVYLYDTSTSQIAMLRCGEKLTQSYIEKLQIMGILGLYIHTGESRDLKENVKYTSIQPELKKEALASIEFTFDLYNHKTQNISADCMNETIEVSRKLVDAVMNDSRIAINVMDLKQYDDYTYQHSLGVSILSIAIGLSLALSKKDLYDLSLCALLHDIGKMSVPIDIISKPTRLTTEEYDIIKQHPTSGAQFLLKHNLANRRVCTGVLTHHERYDGTGYPNCLSCENIPLFGRIISVADVYDALTSYRPYRDPSSAPEALEYVLGGSGKMFDISVVKAFVKKVSPYPVGSCVKLSNGQNAIVVKQNEFNPLRPMVRLFNSPKQAFDLYYQRELQNIVIVGIYDESAKDVIN